MSETSNRIMVSSSTKKTEPRKAAGAVIPRVSCWNWIGFNMSMHQGLGNKQLRAICAFSDER
jgi:hypothetical protein